MTERAKTVREMACKRMPDDAAKVAVIFDQADRIAADEEAFAEATLALASSHGPVFSNAIWVSWSEAGMPV